MPLHHGFFVIRNSISFFHTMSRDIVFSSEKSTSSSQMNGLSAHNARYETGHKIPGSCIGAGSHVIWWGKDCKTFSEERQYCPIMSVYWKKRNALFPITKKPWATALKTSSKLRWQYSIRQCKFEKSSAWWCTMWWKDTVMTEEDLGENSVMNVALLVRTEWPKTGENSAVTGSNGEQSG